MEHTEFITAYVDLAGSARGRRRCSCRSRRCAARGRADWRATVLSSSEGREKEKSKRLREHIELVREGKSQGKEVRQAVVWNVVLILPLGLIYPAWKVLRTISG